MSKPLITPTQLFHSDLFTASSSSSGEERSWIYSAFYLWEEKSNRFTKDCDYTHPWDSGGTQSSRDVWIRPWGVLLVWVQQ